MRVQLEGNVVCVIHQGAGSREDAQAICAALKQHVATAMEQNQTIAIFHDASKMLHASEAYARVFADCFQQIKHERIVQVAYIERPKLRILARLAVALSGMDMKIFKNYHDCQSYLAEQGFTINLLNEKIL